MLLQLYTLSEMVRLLNEESKKSQGNTQKRKRLKTPKEIIDEIKPVRGWHHPVAYPRPLRGFR